MSGAVDLNPPSEFLPRGASCRRLARRREAPPRSGRQHTPSNARPATGVHRHDPRTAARPRRAPAGARSRSLRSLAPPTAPTAPRRQRADRGAPSGRDRRAAGIHDHRGHGRGASPTRHTGSCPDLLTPPAVVPPPQPDRNSRPPRRPRRPPRSQRAPAVAPRRVDDLHGRSIAATPRQHPPHAQHWRTSPSRPSPKCLTTRPPFDLIASARTASCRRRKISAASSPTLERNSVDPDQIGEHHPCRRPIGLTPDENPVRTVPHGA